jgi:hypothetical protein
MKWFFAIFLLSLVSAATLRPECSVSDFVNIASTTNPKDRDERVLDWLNESGPYCTKQSLALIYNNLAQILGTVDSVKIRTKIEQLYERAK